MPGSSGSTRARSTSARASACWCRGGKLDPAYQITVPEDSMPFAETYRRQVALLIRSCRSSPRRNVSRSRAGPPSTCSSATCRACRSISTSPICRSQPRAESLAAIDAAMKRIARPHRAKPSRRAGHRRQASRAPLTRLTGPAPTARRSRSRSRRCCAAASTNRNCGACRRAVEDEFGFAEIQVVSFADSTPARSWPRSTASIRATCSTCAILLAE